MIPIAIHTENLTQCSPATAAISAHVINAVATRTNADGMFNRECLHSQSPSPSPIKDSRRLARLAVYFPTTRLTVKGLARD